MLLMQKSCRDATASDKLAPLGMGETTGKRPCEALSWDSDGYHQEPSRAMSMDSPSSSPGLHPSQAAWNHYPAGFWEEASGIEQDERQAKVAADWAAACMRALEQLEKSPHLKAALAQIGIATLIPTQVALSPDSAQSSRSSST
ncbi:hypothetical protein GUITHDRAFT_153642 [Guillardia theta CCMP2712]|uniref:Uncharacterized protein n=1 Tax=Guillardia theta (strain CCMP2712) TaxID=905079 RepID=L1J0D0_GUITC|nr:hypothetical protein GUITHDRAFT_153642 [Guillardia theta CCMP2712]EKX41988.1 hypothetical protein GUITHDRAFT_153642 [Guillardia theta CCMP2712]|eukprot:XP_005828968.1 hypothetical protein GUITHDRAFT_153642 [Guillardia theta CCMP2712]